MFSLLKQLNWIQCDIHFMPNNKTLVKYLWMNSTIDAQCIKAIRRENAHFFCLVYILYISKCISRNIESNSQWGEFYYEGEFKFSFPWVFNRFFFNFGTLDSGMNLVLYFVNFRKFCTNAQNVYVLKICLNLFEISNWVLKISNFNLNL